MNFKFRHMTVADFMDFVLPQISIPLHHFACKTLMAGPAWTVLYDGRIVCCYGIAPVVKGCGEAWMMMSDEAKARPLVVLRTAKRIFQTIFTSGTYRRIQAMVLADDRQHRNWVEHLGFKVEGVMEKYGPNGETFLRYVMFP